MRLSPKDRFFLVIKYICLVFFYGVVSLPFVVVIA